MTTPARGRFGLTSTALEAITRVFTAHPNVERVLLYGSRAKGTHQAGSDIDLTLCGERLTVSELLEIDLELDDLLLPYKIDLCLHHKIESVDLLEHIERVGKVLYDGVSVDNGARNG